MAGLTLEVNTELTTIDCGVCGGTYAINERYRLQKYQHAGTWHCPYCQTSWGYGETEISRLKLQLESQKKLTEWAKQEAKHAESRRRAAAGQLTKIKRRVGNGVCPCCNRTFKDLALHMKDKHPDYCDA